MPIKLKLTKLKIANKLRRFLRNILRIEDFIDDKLADVVNDLEYVQNDVGEALSELEDRPTHYDLECNVNDYIYQYIEDNIEDIAKKIREENKAVEVTND